MLQAEWAQLSRRLSLAADDISVEGISLARSEAAEMGAVIEASQQKLYATLAIDRLHRRVAADASGALYARCSGSIQH